MASNKITRDHHNLRRNLNLNDKYISNDGGDEGLKVTDAGHTIVTGNLYIDDEGGEYISGDGTDLTITSGRHTILDSAGHVEFDGCGVGFDLVTPTYDATSTVVDFKTGNKQMVTFGAGNITNVELHFPATSGNFVCLFKQDGTGSRTITNYKVFDSEGNAALGSAATKFAGGSEPTLTTDANHVDIISIFWDADNEIAYAVPSLDFQF